MAPRRRSSAWRRWRPRARRARAAASASAPLSAAASDSRRSATVSISLWRSSPITASNRAAAQRFLHRPQQVAAVARRKPSAGARAQDRKRRGRARRARRFRRAPCPRRSRRCFLSARRERRARSGEGPLAWMPSARRPLRWPRHLAGRAKPPAPAQSPSRRRDGPRSPPRSHAARRARDRRRARRRWPRCRAADARAPSAIPAVFCKACRRWRSCSIIV